MTGVRRGGTNIDLFEQRKKIERYIKTRNKKQEAETTVTMLVTGMDEPSGGDYHITIDLYKTSHGGQYWLNQLTCDA